MFTDKDFPAPPLEVEKRGYGSRGGSRKFGFSQPVEGKKRRRDPDDWDTEQMPEERPPKVGAADVTSKSESFFEKTADE